ncbi:hypothetical protein F5B20DRAFT_568012 [Whalleya microplaca]|nr:hypothetical protein F5B20DRAFT_568012 [Whalleya microplaca]
MERLFFEETLKSCRVVPEVTRYLEILSYSDPAYDTIEEHPLDEMDFETFVHRKGVFAPPYLPDGVHRSGGIRLVLQKNANHNDTFSSGVISLKPYEYESMIRAMHLPHRAVEISSCVGPLFWSTFTKIDGGDYLQILFRKSDVRKRGKTRGWELMLSHEIDTGITSGFFKGTENSSIVKAIKDLIACASEARYPLLLPLIVFQHECIDKREAAQRDIRDALRRFEHAICFRSEILEEEGYVQGGQVDLDQIGRDIIEVYNQAKWKPPATFLRIVDALGEAAREFAAQGLAEGPLCTVHNSVVSRLWFYRKRLEGLEDYVKTTVERLDIQRNALDNLIARKESALSIRIAGEQRMLAYASKHDSTAMKVLSLLGAIFLPGAYLASIMSTTFFDFHDAPDLSSAVSPTFWLYWAVTIPVTVVVVAFWYGWEKWRKRRKHEIIEGLVQQGVDVEKMERDILSTMRKRTMSKVSTWRTPSRLSPPKSSTFLKVP